MRPIAAPRRGDDDLLLLLLLLLTVEQMMTVIYRGVPFVVFPIPHDEVPEAS